MHTAFGKARLQAEQAGHLVARSIGIRQSCTQHHIAPAFAVHRALLGEGAQSSAKSRIGREPAGVQFGIAAGQPAHVGAFVGSFIGERREGR